MERTACIFSDTVLISESAKSPRPMRGQIIKRGNKYIYKIALFVTPYTVNSNVIENFSLFPCANILKIFLELGRLCGYDSSSASLRDLHHRRPFDLLVWNTADTTRKTKCYMIYFLKL